MGPTLTLLSNLYDNSYFASLAVPVVQQQILSTNVGGIGFLVTSTVELKGILVYDTRPSTYFSVLEQRVRGVQKTFDKKLSWPLCQVAK
jgi:hypothetical protein